MRPGASIPHRQWPKKIPAYPLNPKTQLHLDLRLREVSPRRMVSIRHICHICRISFSEIFLPPVFHRGFPQTTGGFGVFDTQKPRPCIQWSLSLPVDERFPGAPVAPHPPSGDLTKAVLDCATPFPHSHNGVGTMRVHTDRFHAMPTIGSGEETPALEASPSFIGKVCQSYAAVEGRDVQPSGGSLHDLR